MGGLDYELTDEGLPLKIKNVIYRLEAGKGREAIYAKQLLPNYDIFDEMKYFTAGSEPGIIECQGLTLGLLICEDMWTSNFYRKDAVAQLKERVDKDGVQLDAIINLSASPLLARKGPKKNRPLKGDFPSFEGAFCLCESRGGSKTRFSLTGRA